MKLLVVLKICLMVLLMSGLVFSAVIREEGKVYIVDQTGERWDVTQAESIGFKPERFQCPFGVDI